MSPLRGFILGALVSVAWIDAGPVAAGGEMYPLRGYPVPFPFALADVDSDGDPDLVVFQSTGLALWSNDGAGRFAPTSLTPSGPLAPGALGDFDGDGLTDVASSVGADGVTFRGAGAAGFLPPVTLPGAIESKRAAGDFDEDGFDDLVLCGVSLRVYFGGPSGLQSAATTVIPAAKSADFTCIDMNGDHHLDVVLHSFAIGVQVWLGDGHGQLALATDLPAATVSSAILGDFDQDARPDLLGCVSSEQRFYRGDGAGGFAPPVVLPTLNGTLAADLDADGRLDLIGVAGNSNQMLSIERSIGPATFAPAEIVPAANGGSPQRAVDVDRDGILDVVLRTTTGLAIAHGAGGARFDVELLLPDERVNSVAPGDVDDDGFDDLVEVETDAHGVGEIAVRLGRGDGSFGAPVKTSLHSSPWNDVALGDVDRDGDLDAVTGSDGELSVLENDGSGALAVASTVGVFGNRRLVLADANHDGWLDLARLVAVDWAAVTAVAVALGGPGTDYGTATEVLNVPGASATHLEFADFTNDGAADVATCVAGSLWTVESNGAGGFLPASRTDVAGAQLVAAVRGDWNKDGLADLACADANANGGFRLLIGTGAGFSPGPLVTHGLGNFASRELIDLDADGDGRRDVALTASRLPNGPNAPIVVFPGDGHGGFAAPLVFEDALEDRAVRLRAFDAEHDGRAEIVVPLPLGSFTLSAVAVLPNLLPDQFTCYRRGCPGSGREQARLRLFGSATAGHDVTLTIENALGGATAMVVIGRGPAISPLGGGCSLLVAPVVVTVFPLFLGGTGPGAGTFAFTGAVPAQLPPGSRVALQALILDPGALMGFCATNGVEMHVQP